MVRGRDKMSHKIVNAKKYEPKWIVWWVEPGYGKKYDEKLRGKESASAVRDLIQKQGFRAHIRQVL